MNAKLISLAAMLILGSGAALAATTSTVKSPSAAHVGAWVDGSSYLLDQNFTSTKTREQVRAEALAVSRPSAFVDGSEYELAMNMFMSRLSRQQVRAEAASAERRSATAAGLAEQHGGRN